VHPAPIHRIPSPKAVRRTPKAGFFTSHPTAIYRTIFPNAMCPTPKAGFLSRTPQSTVISQIPSPKAVRRTPKAGFFTSRSTAIYRTPFPKAMRPTPKAGFFISQPAPRNAQPVLSFHHHGHRFPASQAERGQAGFFILFDHFMQQGNQYAASAGTDRMTEGNTAAINIDFCRIQVQLF
jgi:hypothetical protein